MGGGCKYDPWPVYLGSLSISDGFLQLRHSRKSLSTLESCMHNRKQIQCFLPIPAQWVTDVVDWWIDGLIERKLHSVVCLMKCWKITPPLFPWRPHKWASPIMWRDVAVCDSVLINVLKDSRFQRGCLDHSVCHGPEDSWIKCACILMHLYTYVQCSILLM